MSDLTHRWPNGSGPYRVMISEAATAHRVPELLLAWLLWKESRYRKEIINGTKRSPVGAMGIAQFMPTTAREELGSVDAALDPAKAIPGAARYMAKLYAKTGDWNRALAAYNWGIGNLNNKGMDRAPRETIDYVSTIMSKSGANYA